MVFRKGKQSGPAVSRSSVVQSTSSAQSSTSSTSCDLSVTSASTAFGTVSQPKTKYGFHRIGKVAEKGVKYRPWSTEPGVDAVRIQLHKKRDTSYAVLTPRELERCQIGQSLYSSPKSNRILSKETFKSEKRRAKTALGGLTPGRPECKFETRDALPDEVDILQSWARSQQYFPTIYYYITKAVYAGEVVDLLPDNVTNPFGRFLHRFIGGVSIRSPNAKRTKQVSANAIEGGSLEMSKGDRLYYCPQLKIYLPEAAVRLKLASKADRADPKKNRTYNQFIQDSRWA